MKKGICLWLIAGVIQCASAQSFHSLWKDNMPNSKGITVKDSIANERVYQVGTPGVYVFEPSIAENKGTAVLIIPGGGYARLAYQISGWQLAKWFNTFGVTAFVLNHRMPQSRRKSELSGTVRGCTTGNEIYQIARCGLWY